MVATNPFFSLLSLALFVFWVLLLTRVVLSWLELAGVRPPISGPLRSGYELLMDVTEPVLKQIRRVVPPIGMFDISIVVAFIIVMVLWSALP